MLKNIFLFLVLLGVLSCTEQGEKIVNEVYKNSNSVQLNYADSNHISEHVCIYDALERSIDSNNYVRELLVLNFDNSMNLQYVISLDGTDFVDDGTGFDAVAGDGIYTSIMIYDHNNLVPFNSFARKSVFKNVATGNNFIHWNELQDYIPEFNDIPKKSQGMVGAELSCEICTCPCTSCYCLACSAWNGFRCWYFCNCKASISIGIKWSSEASVY